jgi:hypothetical protein
MLKNKQGSNMSHLKQLKLTGLSLLVSVFGVAAVTPLASAASTGGTAAPAKVVKQDVNMRVLPKLRVDKKSFGGVVEVSVPGVSLKKAQCRGMVTVTYQLPTKTITAQKGMVYVKPYANKDGVTVPNGYCVAHIGLTKLKAGDYTITAMLSSTKYLNAGSASGQITIPVKVKPPRQSTTQPASGNSGTTGGTAAPASGGSN